MTLILLLRSATVILALVSGFAALVASHAWLAVVRSLDRSRDVGKGLDRPVLRQAANRSAAALALIGVAALFAGMLQLQ